MKKTLYILALLVFGTGLVSAQEEVKWYSIDEALMLAKQEPRVLMIEVYTDWCGWCKRMDAQTFTDPDVVSTLNAKFYPVKLNAEGKEDIVIGEKTFKFVDNGRRGYHEVAAVVTKGRLSYPTISYLDGDGKVLEASPGFKHADQFKIQLAYYSGGAYKTQEYSDFASSYSSSN